MSFVTPFVYVPAIVMLIGIFFNTRSLYRRGLRTQYADKASAIATVFAVISLSVPLLLFVSMPAAVQIVVWAICGLNFGRAILQIVRAVQWFGRARQADQNAQMPPTNKKEDKRG